MSGAVVNALLVRPDGYICWARAARNDAAPTKFTPTQDGLPTPCTGGSGTRNADSLRTRPCPPRPPGAVPPLPRAPS
ncbi:hypothetical protein [Streptomyces sp. NPDC050263]|uniref:hypothetical protein n=1 Tax=Streptomyces sp. NPDC050263 TaxID=3155037 RepID=UPI003415A9C7